MKKLFLLLALLGMVAVGCSKDDTDKGNDNKTEQPNENEGENEETPVFEVDSDGNYNVEAEGGEVLLAVTTNLEYSVYIPKNARSWIFYEETRAVRSETVVLSVEPNDNTELRTATIELRDAQGKALDKFTIIQKPKAVEEEESVFEIDAEGSYTIPAEGAEIKVNITTNLEYRVEVSEDAKAWLSIGDTRAVRTETLIFTVAKNESDRERTATITIFNKDDEKVFEFRLTQKFNDKADIPEYIFFGLDKESFTFSPDGGSVDVIVYSNYKWEILGTSDWCTPSVKSGDANEDGQIVSFSADMTYDDREATFWFRCADEKIKLVVSQKLKAVIIPDANNSFNFPAEGGIAVISYQTSVDCKVIIPAEAEDWITIAPATRGLVSESITLNIAENTTYSSRTAVIKVVAKDNAELAVEYTINQEQKNGVLVDGNNTFTVPSAGGEVVINYQTNIDCDVIIPDNVQDWITIAPATRGLVSESITLNIAENTTYSSRTAVIKVVAKDNAELAVEYTINQEQKNGVLVDGNNTFTVPSAGGEVVINYQTNIDCDVIIPDEAQEWITIAPATRGLSTYSTTLNIAENNADKERNCVIKVVSKDDNELSVEYTITQNPRYYLYYTSNDGNIVQPYNSSVFGATILSNTYIDGVGVIEFDAPITTIGERAFCNRGSLTSVTIPDSVTTIGDSAFSNCDSLTSVTIPDSVTTIGGWAFGNCSSLTSVYISDISAWCNISFDDSYSNPLSNGCNLYLNNELVTDLTIPDSVTTIGFCAFYNCDSLTSVTIGDSVTTIGNSAFRDCYSLTRVTIGDSVTTIGSSAFEDCTSLTSVTIGDSVTTIGNYAFNVCISLTSVTIPNSVTTIGNEAFSSCYSLKSVTIPDSVTEIGSSAFSGCSSLTSVTIGDSVTMIGSSAFSGCDSLKSVTIPDSVTSIGGAAFYNCNKLKSVYCKPTTPPAGGGNMFNKNALGRKIYVPMWSVGTYESAEGWSDYSYHIEGYYF